MSETSNRDTSFAQCETNVVKLALFWSCRYRTYLSRTYPDGNRYFKFIPAPFAIVSRMMKNTIHLVKLRDDLMFGKVAEQPIEPLFHDLENIRLAAYETKKSPILVILHSIR